MSIIINDNLSGITSNVPTVSLILDFGIKVPLSIGAHSSIKSYIVVFHFVQMPSNKRSDFGFISIWMRGFVFFNNNSNTIQTVCFFSVASINHASENSYTGIV